MTKKKWIKPLCVRIKLVPEEAVLTGCKAGGHSGPFGVHNNCKNRGANCYNPTS